MSRETLDGVLAEARTMLARADNDFSWSHWADVAEALAEIDDLRKQVAIADSNDLLRLRVFFAPTNSLQEVGIASGWGDDFLKLAHRLDDAIDDL